MSHAYPNLIIELEPGCHYVIADSVQWTEDDTVDDCDSEPGRYPERKAGPFPTLEAATTGMVNAFGNPGFINSLSHTQFQALESYMQDWHRAQIEHAALVGH